jgi:hypothetical protein
MHTTHDDTPSRQGSLSLKFRASDPIIMSSQA